MKAVRTFLTALAIGAGVLLVAPSAARADEERAKAYLEAAREDIKSGNFDSVERTLELFEEQLEGVAADVVTKLKAEAATIKKEAAEKKFAAVFDDAEKELTRLEKDRDLARQIKAVQANPKDEDAVAALNGVMQNLKNFETEHLSKLPAGHARTKQITERYQKFAGPIMKLSMAAERDKTLEYIKSNWQMRLDQTKQSANDSPFKSYAEWLASTEDAFFSTYTYQLAGWAKETLADEKVKGFETAFADDAEVVALMKPIHEAYEKGVEKLIGDVTMLVDGLEKGKPDNNALPRVARGTQGLLELAPGEQTKALHERLEAVNKKWENAEKEANAAVSATYDNLEKSAEEMWPSIVSKYEGQTIELDPGAALGNLDSVKGKLVKMSGGTSVDYGGPEYAYVTTVNGQPVAFKLNDRGRKAAAAFQTAVGKPLNPNDFREVIGRVVAVGKVNHIMYDNIREQWVTLGVMDAPICEIVAFKHRYVTLGEDKANTDSLGK